MPTRLTDDQHGLDPFFSTRIQRAIESDREIRAEVRQKRVQAKSARRLSTGASIYISNTLTIEPMLWTEATRKHVGKIGDSGNNRISLARVKFGEAYEKPVLSRAGFLRDGPRAGQFED